jgi:hypothetical protein
MPPGLHRLNLIRSVISKTTLQTSSMENSLHMAVMNCASGTSHHTPHVTEPRTHFFAPGNFEPKSPMSLTWHNKPVIPIGEECNYGHHMYLRSSMRAQFRVRTSCPPYSCATNSVCRITVADTGFGVCYTFTPLFFDIVLATTLWLTSNITKQQVSTCT